MINEDTRSKYFVSEILSLNGAVTSRRFTKFLVWRPDHCTKNPSCYPFHVLFSLTYPINDSQLFDQAHACEERKGLDQYQSGADPAYMTLNTGTWY